LGDFHSLGLVDGHVDIFRCASPLHDIGKAAPTTRQSDEDIDIARARMQRLYGLGIRTIISLEDPDKPNEGGDAPNAAKAAALKWRVSLERMEAQETGIRFVPMPMANAGPGSLQEMSDAQVLALLNRVSDEVFGDAKTGGVVFHCSAGHDRTGIVAAFIRIKYEHWPVDQAIDEMRRYGHNWLKFSNNGGTSSWHEDHLRAIATLLAQPTTEPTGEHQEIGQR
jgi:protein-tyrosine phosphatase